MVTAPPRLVLVLGDQLSHGLSALRAADRARDVVLMAEVAEEAGYVPHHPKKIVLVLSAMRKFAQELRTQGWQVRYLPLDAPDAPTSIAGALLAGAEALGCGAVLATEPGEWRLRAALAALPLNVTVLPDDRFLCPRADFAAWAQGRKTLRMEHFYRLMRRRTGLLMEGDEPAGGQWNFDHDNRKPARGDMFRQGPLRHAPDPVVAQVIALVQARFGSNFGTLEPFWLPTDRAQALAGFEHFIAHDLPDFGTYQDAMLASDPFLHHAVIAPAMNLGLLSPAEVCARVEAEWRAGRVPINAAEGFIRQILGWREYVRGIYDLHGPGYTAQNALGHTRPLPPLYWGKPTQMACVKAAVSQTREHAYAHHIQRLMVTGNFALLAGVNPQEVHEWYLAVYADAYEWVEAPNTLGMSQFADGGRLASKPYVSSGAYINRMSDYCSGCRYSVTARTGPDACPFNLLYWHFLNRHREKLAKNPRMAQMFRTWDKMDMDHWSLVLEQAEALLSRLDAGAVV